MTQANILSTTEHKFYNKCLNWEVLQSYAQNYLISNLMLATGLKIGAGACLPWCSISSSIQNFLKTSGHRGYKSGDLVLEFPFLPDIGFQLLKSLWLSLTYFSFNDVPYFLYRETFIYFSAFIVPSKKCKLPILYALMYPNIIRESTFWTECW